MLYIFAVMLLSGGVGWLFRKRNLPRAVISKAVSGLILALMLAIGVEVGSNKNVLSSIGDIFYDAAILTLAVLVGTWCVAWIADRTLIRSKVEPDDSIKRHPAAALGFSLLIVGVFALGVVLGAVGLAPSETTSFSMTALYLLMTLVGFSIGSDRGTLAVLAGQPWRVVFAPIATIVGTLAGVVLFSPLIDFNLFEQLAIGSGFGYYSLSSVLLREMCGPQIGAIALLVNVMRELLTVVLAPFIVRFFSPTALVCSGGATTIDVTLPVIVGRCGPHMIGMAVFHGVAVDLSVPLLVSLFASLS